MTHHVGCVSILEPSIGCRELHTGQTAGPTPAGDPDKRARVMVYRGTLWRELVALGRSTRNFRRFDRELHADLADPWLVRAR